MNISPTLRFPSPRQGAPVPKGLEELEKWIEDGSTGKLSGNLPAGVTPEMAVDLCRKHEEKHPASVAVLRENFRIEDALREAAREETEKLGESIDELQNSSESEDAPSRFGKLANIFLEHFGKPVWAHKNTLLKLSGSSFIASCLASVAGVLVASQVDKKSELTALLVSTTAQALTGAAFGYRLGDTVAKNKPWAQDSRWRQAPALGLSLGCAALAATTLIQYWTMASTEEKTADERQEEMVNSQVFTAVYSVIQELAKLFLLPVLLKLFNSNASELELPEDRQLRLACSKDKDLALHSTRLALGVLAYWAMSSGLGMSVGKVIHHADVDENSSVLREEAVIGISRAANEMFEVFFGALALLATFGPAVKESHGTENEEHHMVARAFTNLSAATFARCLDDANFEQAALGKSAFTALTHLKDALVNALPAHTPPSALPLVSLRTASSRHMTSENSLANLQEMVNQLGDESVLASNSLFRKARSALEVSQPIETLSTPRHSQWGSEFEEEEKSSES